jgi:predicted nucleic acid-binding protein
MIFVVDASVAVKWFSREEDHARAVMVADRASQIIAPDFVILETLNVIWKQRRRNELTHAQATEARVLLAGYFDKLVPANALAAQTFSLAAEMDHSVYDCAYLACALAENCRLVTADAKFAAKATSAGYTENILSLSSFDPSEHLH